MDDILRAARTALKQVADPTKAGPMAADMKFHGVQKPERKPILKELRTTFEPQSRSEFEQAVLVVCAASSFKKSG